MQKRRSLRCRKQKSSEQTISESNESSESLSEVSEKASDMEVEPEDN